MKEIKLFMFEGCPHCALARKCIGELLASHPEYKKVPFEMIDEHVHPEIADKFDYYYVPTFYVGGKKIHEGHAEMADVERVFKAALEG